MYYTYWLNAAHTCTSCRIKRSRNQTKFGGFPNNLGFKGFSFQLSKELFHKIIIKNWHTYKANWRGKCTLLVWSMVISFLLFLNNEINVVENWMKNHYFTWLIVNFCNYFLLHILYTKQIISLICNALPIPKPHKLHQTQKQMCTFDFCIMWKCI